MNKQLTDNRRGLLLLLLIMAAVLLVAGFVPGIYASADETVAEFTVAPSYGSGIQSIADRASFVFTVTNTTQVTVSSVEFKYIMSDSSVTPSVTDFETTGVDVDGNSVAIDATAANCQKKYFHFASFYHYGAGALEYNVNVLATAYEVNFFTPRFTVSGVLSGTAAEYTSNQLTKSDVEVLVTLDPAVSAFITSSGYQNTSYQYYVSDVAMSKAQLTSLSAASWSAAVQNAGGSNCYSTAGNTATRLQKYVYFRVTAGSGVQKITYYQDGAFRVNLNRLPSFVVSADNGYAGTYVNDDVSVSLGLFDTAYAVGDVNFYYYESASAVANPAAVDESDWNSITPDGSDVRWTMLQSTVSSSSDKYYDKYLYFRAVSAENSAYVAYGVKGERVRIDTRTPSFTAFSMDEYNGSSVVSSDYNGVALHSYSGSNYLPYNGAWRSDNGGFQLIITVLASSFEGDAVTVMYSTNGGASYTHLSGAEQATVKVGGVDTPARRFTLRLRSIDTNEFRIKAVSGNNISTVYTDGGASAKDYTVRVDSVVPSFTVTPSRAGNVVNGVTYYYTLPTLYVEPSADNISGVTYSYYSTLVDTQNQASISSENLNPYTSEGVSFGAQTGAGTKYQYFRATSGAGATNEYFFPFNYDTYLPELSMTYASEGAITATETSRDLGAGESIAVYTLNRAANNSLAITFANSNTDSRAPSSFYYKDMNDAAAEYTLIGTGGGRAVTLTVGTLGTYRYLIRIQSGALSIANTDTVQEGLVYEEYELNFVVCEKNYFFDVETEYQNQWTNENINVDFVFDDDGFDYAVYCTAIIGGTTLEAKLNDLPDDYFRIDADGERVLFEGDAGYDDYEYAAFTDGRIRYRYVLGCEDYVAGSSTAADCQINSVQMNFRAENMANTEKQCLYENESGTQVDKGHFIVKMDKVVPEIEFVTLFDGDLEAYDYAISGSQWYAEELFVLLRNTAETIAPLSGSVKIGGYTAELSVYDPADFSGHTYDTTGRQYYYYEISVSMDDNVPLVFSLSTEAGNEARENYYARVDMTEPNFRLIDGRNPSNVYTANATFASFVGNKLGDGSTGYPIYLEPTQTGYSSDNYSYRFRQTNQAGNIFYNATYTANGYLANIFVADANAYAASTADFEFIVTKDAKTSSSTPATDSKITKTITLTIKYDFGDFTQLGTDPTFTLGSVQAFSYDTNNNIVTTAYTASDSYYSNKQLRVELGCIKSNGNNVGSGTYFQFKVGGNPAEETNWINIANQEGGDNPYFTDSWGYFYISSDQYPTAYNSNLYFRAVTGAGKTSEIKSVYIRNDQLMPEPSFDYDGSYSPTAVVLTPTNSSGNLAPVYYQYIVGGSGETPVWGDTWTLLNNASGVGYTVTADSVTVNTSGLWISFRAYVVVEGSSRYSVETAADGKIFRVLIDSAVAEFVDVAIGESNSSQNDYGEWTSPDRFEFFPSGTGHLFRLSGVAKDAVSGEETDSMLNYWYRIGNFASPTEGWELIDRWYDYNPNNVSSPWSVYEQTDMPAKADGSQYKTYYFKIDWTASGNLWFKITTEAGEGQIWNEYFTIETDVDAPDFVIGAYTNAANGAREEYIEGTWKTSYVILTIDQKSSGAADYAYSIDAVDAQGNVDYANASWIPFASSEFSTSALVASGYTGVETITVRAISQNNGKITYKEFRAYRDATVPVPVIGSFDSGLSSGAWSKSSSVRFAVFNYAANNSDITYSWYIYYGNSVVGESQGYLDESVPFAYNSISFFEPGTGKRLLNQRTLSKAFSVGYDGVTTKYTVVVNAVSEAGLTATASFVINIDIYAPVISVTGMVSGDTCYVDRYIQYSDDNNNQNIKKATINGYDILSGTWVNRKSHPVNSENEFVIVVTDYAGNTTTFRFTMLEFPAKVYTVKISQRDLVDALESEVNAVVAARPDLSSNRQTYYEDLIYSLNVRIDYLIRQTEVFISDVDPLPVSLDEITLGAHYFLALELLDDWEQLTDEQQAIEDVVTAYGKLYNIYEYLLDERAVVDAVELSAYNLPSRNFVKLTDKTQVVGVQSAYNLLTQDQKVVFDSYLYNKIEALLDIIDSYNLIVDFKDAAGENLYSVKVESTVASAVVLSAIEVPATSEQFVNAQNKVIEKLGNFKIIQMFNMSYIRDDITVVPTSAMVITLPLASEIVSRDDYKIIHVLNNGDVELIQSYTLNPDGVTVSFNATSFSGYAVAVKATVTTVSTEVVSTGSNAGLVVDPEMLVYVGGGVAGVVVLLLVVLLITSLVRRRSIEGKYAVKRYNKKLLREQKKLMLKKYNAQAKLKKEELELLAAEKAEQKPAAPKPMPAPARSSAPGQAAGVKINPTPKK